MIVKTILWYMSRLAALILFFSIVSCTTNQYNEFNVIPYPAEVSLLEGNYVISGADLYVDADSCVKAAVHKFAAQLTRVTGRKSTVVADSTKAGVCFFTRQGLPAEGYRINIGKEGVRIEAADYNGFFYAIQTIRQMLPAQVYGDKRSRASWTLQYAEIYDFPRFEYRGLLLDPPRYFISVEETKRILDAMALYKLNRLHWHLTDDQGWRWEVKKYPKLTEIGAWRNGSCLHSYIESYDNVPHGGFYTQDELKEMVAYAAERGIEIVPEVDLPGHMVAALTAYPEYGCTGGPYEPCKTWGVTKDILCAGNDDIYVFIEDVLTELVEIFPSEYIHIGGDECPRVRWEECPKCQALIKKLGLTDSGNVSAEAKLQNYVMERAQKMLEKRGRKVACWNEAIEGDLNKDITVFAWFDGKIGSEPGAESASRGYQTVLCNLEDLYFVWPQNPDVESEPYAAMRRVTLPTMGVYEYSPLSELEPGTEHLIKGVQGHLWGSYMPTDEILEYSLFPRLCALSEVQWCDEGNKDTERFRKAVNHSFDILEELGYTYCPCLDENPEGERYKGLFKNYDFDVEVVNQSAPKGYEPFYLVNFARHGACYLYDDAEYELIAKVLDNATLTPLGQDVKDRFHEIYPKIKGRNAELTAVGVEQQQKLAYRMYADWPIIFRNGSQVKAVAADMEQCVSSMEIFLSALKDCNSKIITSENYSSDILSVPVEPIDMNETFYHFADPDMLYRRLFTDVAQAKILSGAAEFVSAIYHFATRLDNFDIKDEVIESAFTDQMASTLGYIDDRACSYNGGWGVPKNVAASWPVLDQLISAVEEDVTSFQRGSSLYFTDAQTLMSMLSLLKVGVFKERFFDCDSVTMSANLRWIFAKNKSGDIIVKIQYNENDKTEWMQWDEFREFCQEQIEWAKAQ